MAKKTKRMRLPNGFGSISNLGGNRRKPYLARKTVGKDEFGKPITKPIKPQSCFATYNEAYEALLNYNKNPYDESKDLTVAQVYDKWSPTRFKKLSQKRITALEGAFRRCNKIHNRKINELRTAELETIIKDSSGSDIMRIDARSLLISMFEYALKYEIVEKNYAKLTDPISRPEAAINRVLFSEDEIKALWNLREVHGVDMILVGLYTGLRPSEICELKTENVHLGERYLTGGMKTEAGKNRIIPIHEEIIKIIEDHAGNGTLFKSLTGKDMDYSKYQYSFNNVMDILKAKHSPHDTRHTFITTAKNCGMNEYCLKLIVGHVITDITEKVYTHRTIEELIQEINKIKF